MSKSLLMTGKRRSPYYPVGSDCVLYQTYWGGTFVDHSGKGNNGTPHNVTLGAAGAIFPGTHDGYIEVVPATSLNPGTGSVSWYIWANITDADHKWLLLAGGSDTTSIYVESDPNRALFGRLKNVGQAGKGGGGPGWHLYNFSVNRGVAYLVSIDGVLSDPDPETEATDLTWQDFYAIGSYVPWLGAYSIVGTVGEVLQFNSYKTQADTSAYLNATKGRYGL